MNHLEIPNTPFYLLRDGETNWNGKHRIMRQADIPFNPTGVHQAKSVAQLLKTCASFEYIVTSPLERALQTTEIIAQIHNETFTFFTIILIVIMNVKLIKY